MFQTHDFYKAHIPTLVSNAFPNNTLASLSKLTEGFYNIAYAVTLTNGQKAVLKIAPPLTTKIMTYEENIMYSEVTALDLLSKKTSLPLPKVLYYDDSYSLIDSQYFFMEMLPGASLKSQESTLSHITKREINLQVGHDVRQMNAVSGNQFGYFGQPHKQGTDWYQVFSTMIHDGFSDARAMNIDLSVDESTIMDRLAADKSYFDAVKFPRFVHWDLWSGNIFVKDQQVIGYIDFERCLWGDPLMEYGFRVFRNDLDFIEGYGMEQLSNEELRRATWYDIYFFLLVSLECDYRHYNSKDSYHWANQMLTDIVASKL